MSIQWVVYSETRKKYFCNACQYDVWLDKPGRLYSRRYDSVNRLNDLEGRYTDDLTIHEIELKDITINN